MSAQLKEDWQWKVRLNIWTLQDEMSVERVNDCEKIQPFTSKNYIIGIEIILYKGSVMDYGDFKKKWKDLEVCLDSSFRSK